MPQLNFKNIIPKRRLNSNKKDYGHVFILAGSLGLTGAAYLCSQAAILSGNGLVTLGIPKSLNRIMAIKLTEVMLKPLEETKEASLSYKALPAILKFSQKADALAIGPGLSQNAQTQKLIIDLIKKINKPLIIDADGLNALAKNISILKNNKKEIVLTPHPGEMARLIGKTIAYVQANRKKVAKEFSLRYNLTTVLKGYNTVVASPQGEIWINKTGNPGMATAGCGDVLTGIIASLVGQGIKPFAAAKLAVYLHGLSGDLAAKEKGQISLIAGNILNKLPVIFKRYSK